MSNRKVQVDGLADAVMEMLTDYSDLSAEKTKAAVKKAGSTVRREIQQGAPEQTGRYDGAGV